MAAGSSGDLSHSFTDLMTSLAVIFILLLVATLNNAFSESESTITDLRKEVAEELKKLNLTLSPDPEDPYTQIINLDEDKVKFEFNEATLKPEGKQVISHLFEILAPRLCDDHFRSKIESVIVEGHTDSTGNHTTEGKLKNVKLSQDRAYTVMHQALVALDIEKGTYQDCFRNIALATGRGSAKLKATDSASRRVEIKIRVKTAKGL